MLRVRPKSRKRGFTLVEVIVVLVIIAILAAIAIPALTGYIDKSKEFELVADTRVAVAAIQTWASYNYADGYRGNGGLVTQEGDPATFIAYDGDRPVASTGLYYEGDAGTPRLQGTDTTPKISPHTFYITYKFENEDGSFTMKDAPYSDNGGLFEYNVNVYENEPIDFYITDFMLDGAQREITTLPQPPAIPAGYVPSREITEQVESGEPLKYTDYGSAGASTNYIFRITLTYELEDEDNKKSAPPSTWLNIVNKLSTTKYSDDDDYKINEVYFDESNKLTHLKFRKDDHFVVYDGTNYHYDEETMLPGESDIT